MIILVRSKNNFFGWHSIHYRTSKENVKHRMFNIFTKKRPEDRDDHLGAARTTGPEVLTALEFVLNGVS